MSSENSNKTLERLFLQIKKNVIFAPGSAGVAQLVEHDLAKVGVAGSSPVSRSKKPYENAAYFIFRLNS
jgi:hypothetical protein